MNSKQITILIVAGVLIGGLGLVLSRKKSESWNSSERSATQKVLGDFPINDVAQIAIRQGSNELNLVKAEIWQVKERQGYPANFASISDFLRKAADLRPVQKVKVGPSQFGRLELTSPPGGTNSGTLIEFKDKDGKPIKGLLLGKKYMRESPGDAQFGGGGFPAGRYLMIPGEAASVAVVSEPFSEIEPNADHWLNKDFFKVEKLRSVSVTSTNATNSWTITREAENGELKLADSKEGEQFDPSRAASVGSALSFPSFNDVAGPEAASAMTNPVAATLETFDNFIYTVKMAEKSPDGDYYLQVAVSADIKKERAPGADEKPEDKEKLDKEFKENTDKLEEKLKREKNFEKWTYIVSKWTVEPLLKARSDFMAEKKPETPAPAPSAPPIPGLDSLPGLPNILPQ